MGRMPLVECRIILFRLRVIGSRESSSRHSRHAAWFKLDTELLLPPTGNLPALDIFPTYLSESHCSMGPATLSIRSYTRPLLSARAGWDYSFASVHAAQHAPLLLAYAGWDPIHLIARNHHEQICRGPIECIGRQRAEDVAVLWDISQKAEKESSCAGKPLTLILFDSDEMNNNNNNNQNNDNDCKNNSNSVIKYHIYSIDFDQIV